MFQSATTGRQHLRLTVDTICLLTRNQHEAHFVKVSWKCNFGPIRVLNEASQYTEVLKIAVIYNHLTEF
jgi:hypothetical protein